jgi:hypothetical protein
LLHGDDEGLVALREPLSSDLMVVHEALGGKQLEKEQKDWGGEN